MKSRTYLILSVVLLSLSFALPAKAQAAQHSVILTWTAPAAQAGITISGYNVYRVTSPGTEIMGQHPTFPNIVPGTTFTDTTVNAGEVWYYVVTSWCQSCANGSGGSGTESVFSNEVKATVPVSAIKPGAPTVTTVVVQ